MIRVYLFVFGLIRVNTISGRDFDNIYKFYKTCNGTNPADCTSSSNSVTSGLPIISSLSVRSNEACAALCAALDQCRVYGFHTLTARGAGQCMLMQEYFNCTVMHDQPCTSFYAKVSLNLLIELSKDRRPLQFTETLDYFRVRLVFLS